MTVTSRIGAGGARANGRGLWGKFGVKDHRRWGACLLHK